MQKARSRNKRGRKLLFLISSIVEYSLFLTPSNDIILLPFLLFLPFVVTKPSNISVKKDYSRNYKAPSKIPRGEDFCAPLNCTW